MIALLNILGFCFILKIVSVISNRACPSVGKECEIGHWLEWGKCDATCGGGYRIRRKPMCCNINYGKTLDDCLQHCKMNKSNFINITTDSKSCAPYCYNLGHFNTATNKCDCFKGSYGKCCDKRYPRLTTVHRQQNQSGNLRVTMIPGQQHQSGYSSVTRFPGQQHHSGYPSVTRIPVKRQQSRYPSFTNIPRQQMTERNNSYKFQGNSPINLHNAQNNVQMMSLCITQPCKHGTCVPLQNGYFCFCDSGYVGRNCQIDEDDCQTDPCQYGQCVDRVNGFHCECNVFFKGNRCSKMKFWAIITISIGASALLFLCCCCAWCCPFSRRRKQEEKETRPVKETGKSLQAWT